MVLVAPLAQIDLSANNVQARLAETATSVLTFAQLAFSGLDLVPPGVVLVSEWHREAGGPFPTPAEVACYGGVARKR